jgi:hypothetical protein
VELRLIIFLSANDKHFEGMDASRQRIAFSLRTVRIPCAREKIPCVPA